MIDKKYLKISACMISGLLFCPLINFAQLHTIEIKVEETPFMSDISIECLNENIRLTVHLENPGLNTTYIMSGNIATNTQPETNTTGIFIVPNLAVLQSAIFETNYGYCADIREISFECPAAILPVDIVNVYAQLLNDNEAAIIWEIANEQNVEHYIVEKSYDGSTFDEIGRVPVTEELTSFKTYKYEDKSLFSGINYYRIKIEDFDGSIYYTKIVSVDNDSEKMIGLKVYPNPTSNNLFVEYNNAKATNVDLSIYNQLGQLVTSSKYTDGIFPKIIELSLLELNEGTYFIKATDQHGNKIISKFFKMK